MLHGLNADLKEYNDSGMQINPVAYFRPCQPTELLADVMKEAEEHGCILAFKGHVTCIMPRLVEGWTEHGRAPK